MCTKYDTVESQINVSHFSDISQINNIIGADQIQIYYISASQINDNLTLRINLPLTNDIVNTCYFYANYFKRQ